METYLLKDDIRLLCVDATSFPDGITEAHDRLHKLISSAKGRKFYGISYGTGHGKTVYKAAVEQVNENEADQLQLARYVVKKGEYVGTRIINYTDHIDSVGKTFQKLLSNPRLDPKGCCVEVYLNDRDMQCMVRLESK